MHDCELPRVLSGLRQCSQGHPYASKVVDYKDIDSQKSDQLNLLVLIYWYTQQSHRPQSHIEAIRQFLIS